MPDEHRDQFDELLGEARLTYRLRDERGVFSDIWASGLMRRAALAGGRRLAGKGRIHDAEHLIDAGFDEMCALVIGRGRTLRGRARGSGPSTEPRTARRRLRASLGEPPPPPPDPAGLPPGVGRVMRATGISLGHLFGSSEAEHEEHVLRGLAASRGVYEGPARRISGPAEFDRIVKGDVLVTQSTTEAFNILLPLLGAIVTDSGGLLSHSAIVAREYGIPGVVGTREATERIADGARVRVDGDAGEVTVLGEGGRPAGEGARDGAVRLKGGRAGSGDAGRAAGPAGSCALRPDRRGRRRRQRARDQEGRRSRSARSAARWPFARLPWTRTVPRRASPAST